MTTRALNASRSRDQESRGRRRLQHLTVAYVLLVVLFLIALHL